MELIGGGLLGGVIGVAIAELVRLYQRPRVKFLELESTQPKRGLAGGEQYLRRIKFEVKGSSSGTATSIELRWGPDPRQGTYAKWDETPEPAETNPVTGAWENRPNIVPATFFLPLYAKEEYTVPILIDWDASGEAQPGLPRVLDVFCGWWYVERKPEPYRLRVVPGDVIKVKVQGMPWIVGWFRCRKAEREFTVDELQQGPLRRDETPERGGPE